tara:strand:- start:528 stop:974 length:447 start_codon:yes stop_codon:yes gene_type:complete
MLLEAADTQSEGILAGGAELTDNVVRLLEDANISSLDGPQFKDLFGPGSNSLPGGFPEAWIGTDGSFTFGAGDSSISLMGGDGGSMISGPMGDSMSSILQTTAGMPGGMGLIGSFFQFLGALLTNMTTAALDPTMLAQQAAGSIRKLG